MIPGAARTCFLNTSAYCAPSVAIFYDLFVKMTNICLVKALYEHTRNVCTSYCQSEPRAIQFSEGDGIIYCPDSCFLFHLLSSSNNRPVKVNRVQYN